MRAFADLAAFPTQTDDPLAEILGNDALPQPFGHRNAPCKNEFAFLGVNLGRVLASDFGKLSRTAVAFYILGLEKLRLKPSPASHPAIFAGFRALICRTRSRVRPICSPICLQCQRIIAFQTIAGSFRILAARWVNRGPSTRKDAADRRCPGQSRPASSYSCRRPIN